MAIIEISDYEQWKQQQAQRTAAGANVVLGSIDTKPDDVAGDMNLGQEFAKTTGQPVPPLPLVTEYRPVFQQAIERSRNATILSGSPMLASWLKKPENAAIARDDLEGLAAIEGMVRRPAKTEYTTEELARMAPAGRMSDAFGMGQARAITQGQSLTRDLAATLEAGPLGQGLDAARGTMDDALLTGDDGQPNLLGRLANFARSRAEAADGVPRSMVGGPDVALDDRVAAIEGAEFNEFYRGAEALLSEMDERGFAPMMYNEVDGIGSAVRFIGENLSMSLPQMGVALASGAFAPLLQITMLGGEANEELKERTDLTRDQRVAVSLGAGTVMTALETFGLSKIFGGLPVSQMAVDALDGTLTQKLVQNGLSQAAARTLSAGIAEGSTELLQEGIVMSVTALAGGEYTREEVIDRLAQGFFAGGGSGSGLRAGVEAGAAIRRPIDRHMAGQQAAQDAENRQAMFQELSGQAVNSRLRARMPDAFRQFVERATENGPVENVFVPAEKFQEYFQGIGTDPFALADELEGVSADALRDALATGGDLQIPTATYAASIAGSEHDAFLMENMRFDPDEFTSFEAREFNEKAQEALEEAYAEAEDMRRTDEALRTFEQEIYDTMVERLRIAGRSTDVATSEAMLFPAFYRTMAERSGMQIDELMRRYPLPQVQGELPQGIQNRDVDALSRTLAEARSQRQVNTGPRTPLLEFISDYGGMIDTGGELASRDAALIQRGRGRTNLRLLRDPNTQVSSASAEKNRAFGVDDVAQAAIEAGFMAGNPIVMEYQESLRTGREAPDITRALFDEIDREMRGEASLTQDELRDGVDDDTLGGLEEYLSRIGMSLDDSDADIRAAIERDQAEQGAMYGQDGQIATDSEAFKAWFGDSKVVGPDGEPLVVYHHGSFDENSDVPGGPMHFGTAQAARERAFGKATDDAAMAVEAYENDDGVWHWDDGSGMTSEEMGAAGFSDPEVAVAYGRSEVIRQMEEGGLDVEADDLGGTTATYLSIQNPKRLTDVGGANGEWDAAIAQAIAEGHDGIVYRNQFEDKGSDSFIAFTPTQIKSVNNRGTFDANDPRILFQGAADQGGDLLTRLLAEAEANLERKANLSEELAAAGGSVLFKTPGGQRAMAGPDMSKPGGFRLTYIGEDGKPNGHSEFTSLKDAIRRALDDRFDPIVGRDYNQPAYHGTPHLFEKFSLSAIGTGEGAQAFGWGLYFAGRKEVAEFYRETLTRDGVIRVAGQDLTYDEKPELFAAAEQKLRGKLDAYEAYSNRLAADGRMSPEELAGRMAAISEVRGADVAVPPRGRLFEVNIPEDAELLDWDAPLSEQPEAVREKLQTMLDRVREIDRAFIADQRQAESDAATGAPISDEMAALLDDLDLPDVSPEEQAATDAAAAAREAERVETLLNLKWGDSKKVMGLHAELAGFFAENDAAWSLIGKTPDDVMNTQQAASELLRDAGIPGHRYLDGGSRADGDGSYNYVIYDDSRIDVARFEQENRGSIQFPGGGVGNGDTVINLFRKADLSTFLHESGHYFLTVLQDMARQGETTAVAELDVIKSEWRKNAGAVAADAMRVMPDVTITEADVNTALDNGTTGDVLKDAAIDVGMQEQFARGFERYLMEGKAPTQELRSAFEKFRAWLMSVYKSLRGLNVEISDEMRAVFDRMLATDAEIATASEASGDAGPLFASAEDMGLSADDYAAFLRLTQQANDEASAKLLAETMAPIRRETEKWFKDERAKVRADVEREVNAYRQYRALEWMGNRRWLGEGKPEALGDFRLSKGMLVERYGVGVLKTLPRGKQTVYAVEGGIDPDVAADLFGYSSADEMIKSMEQAPPRREAIEAETDRKMFELHGDPLKDGSVQQQALDAVHGDKRARALAVELKALADIAGSDRGMTHKEAREIARQTLNRTRVRDAIASNRYLSAERKAGEEARRLSARVTRTGMWADAARRRVGVQARAGVREGDTAAPARVAAQVDRANTSTARYNENVTALVEAKRRQLMNHALYSEARRIEAEVQSAERLVTRLSKKSTREKLAGDYLEAIDELLTRYDFRRMSGRAEDRRGALAAFIERMTAEGRENELAIPDRVLQDSARTPYKKLTVEHLRGVVDSLKNIEHTARLKKTLQDAQSQRELDAVVDDITAAFDKNLPKRPPGRVGDNAEGRRNTVRRFLDLVLNATTLLREIDGREDFGPAYRNIKAPIDAAMNRLQGRRQKAAQDLDSLYEVYTKQERRAMAVREFIPEVDASLSKWERIAVALNMGNEGNYQRMTDTSVRGGFTEAQVAAIVGTLDARDAAFVQSVWNYLETFRPDIEAREKRTTGVAPKFVEPRAVTIAGETLNGGYYPLRYDPRLSALARDDQAQDISKSLQAGRFGKAQTRNGHLKERAQSSGRAVELDISVLHQHVQQVVYDLELSEPVNNSWRILQDSRIREAFTDTGKQADFDALEVWLKDVAEGEIRSSDAVGKMARRFKSNFTAAKLAFNMSTVAVQITGVSQSMVVVGKKDFLNGVVASFRPGVEAEVVAKSQFMRDRQTTFNKDIFDLYNDPKMGPAVGRWTEVRNEWIAPAGFWLMTKVQFYSVDLPSWMAGYQQGLRKFDNNEDMAIAFADDVVKRAQASGLFSDRSAIERGSTSMAARQNDFIRLFTTLGSYMFAKFNVAYERTQRARGVIRDEGASMRSVQEAFSWTLDMAFLFTLEAILYMAIKGRLPDEEDDEDGDGMGDEWATFLARETALSIASSIPFVRDLGGIYAGFSGGGAYGAMTEELTRPLQQAAQGEVDRPFVKSIINATGLFTGLPTGQINRAVDAGWRAAEGEDVSPAEYILGRMGN